MPPPRLNLVRYHGVLAPNAVDRAQIVPGPQEEVKEEVEMSPEITSEGDPILAQRRHRLAWAVLLARVWAIDVTECPACGGRMKIVAAVTDPRSIGRYLKGVGLPSRAPPIAPPPTTTSAAGVRPGVFRLLSSVLPLTWAGGGRVSARVDTAGLPGKKCG